MRNPNDHVIEIVDDYIHDVISPEDAELVVQHCERCRVCKVALEEARKRQAALETVPTCEASEQLIRTTLGKIEAYERNWFRSRGVMGWSAFAAVAASVLVLTGFHLYYLRLVPSPYALTLLGQGSLLAGTDGAVRVRLIRQTTGAPVPGVPVMIQLLDKSRQEIVQLASFTTNSQGTGEPRFQLPDWSEGNYELQVVAKAPGALEVLTERIRLRRAWKLMLTSDKPIYQPGQTIHVRALALRKPDLKPVAGQDMTFTMTDPKGNLVFKQTDPSSRFGIAAVDCPLAMEIIEGSYAVACKIGDVESKTTVEVKKYVLPKFKIGIELDQPYYQPGQAVRGKLHADYFFGKPVADAAVEIEVQTADIGPQVLQRLNARTSASGDAAFDFTLPKTLVGTEQRSGDAGFAVVATLIDTAGQKQSRMVTRNVTSRPVRIEVIPEGGTLVRDLSNKVFLYVSYADGTPAQAKLAVTGQEQELATNELGLATLELTPRETEVGLTIRAVDAKGQVGHQHARLRVGQPTGDFLLRTDKAVYNGGDTVHLSLQGSGVEPVFVDFLKDDQTMLTELVDLNGGRGDLQLDLPADLFGTVRLCAYRFDASGLAVRKTRTMFIRQAGQLQVQTTLDQGEYQPGRQAKLQLALKDKQGKPVAGAVSLAAVDEAVYAVLEQAPGMERTFYLLEQQLLKPVYAIYPWSPDLTTSTGPEQRQQFEQALFARTASSTVETNLPGPSWNRNLKPSAPTPEMNPHSLAVSSYPNKVKLTEQARSDGLHHVHIAWAVLGGLGLLAAYASLWFLIRTWILLSVHALGLILVGVCFMSVMVLGRNANQTFNQVGSSIGAGGGFAPTRDMAPMSMAKSEAPSRVMPPMNADRRPRVDAPAAPATQEPVRVREFFPETLLWRPEVITDDAGRATVDITLADSITTWRLLASAVTADGRLGAAQSPIRVFQPFFVDLNLPVSLTRGDEVAVPAVVYNYLNKPQTVELTLADEKWFERTGDAVLRVELAPGEVRATAYRLRARLVGNHHLQVTARGSGVADALKKEIEVVPDGRPVEQVVNGNLQQPAQLNLALPAQAIEGSARAIVKVYPTTFSQLVEGLDSIFRMPCGCFEQTSSSTYPNVLALDYLRRTKKSVPAVEAKARQYISLGYQRLLGFEVAGGGFDWFARPPANRTLTAYGLMEFQDMAKVHDVDPRLIERTRQWLMKQRNADGSWTPEEHQLHDDPTRRSAGAEMARLATTAYIAWAVFSDSSTQSMVMPTRDFLLAHNPATISDPHVLAMTCNALRVIDPAGKEVGPYLDRLESLKRESADGKQVWWEQSEAGRTMFFGAGRSGAIETTALATLALVGNGEHAVTTRRALTWLVAQKDAFGTWQSTQATVLALKALLAGTETPLGGEQERRFEISLGNGKTMEKSIPVDQSEVVLQLDLSVGLQTGENRLTLTEKSDTGANYQVMFRYYVPRAKDDKPSEPLAIDIVYDRTELAVGNTVTADATIVNRMTKTAPMVILDLPIPPGFALETEDLEALVKAGTIAKYQVNPRSAVVYLRGLEPEKPLKLRYRLHATMPVKVSVPSGTVYEYYDKDKRGTSRPARMVVLPNAARR